MSRLQESKQVGRRLLINYIDAVAAENPTKVALIQTISFDPPVQLSVTYQGLSSIINRLAWWLADNLDGKIEGVTIPYLAPSDARHLIFSLAAVKAGSRLLLHSPRNSVTIHDHLIEETKSPAIIYDTSFSSTIKELTSSSQVKVIQAPPLADLLSNTDPGKEYPYSETFDDGSGKPLVVFHTSGSTGLPKPVTFVHAAMAASDNLRRLHSKESNRDCIYRALEKTPSIYNGCPLFHAAGFMAGLFMMLSGSVLIIGPPGQPSSPQMFKQMLHATRPENVLLPPLVVDQIAQEPAMVKEASKLKMLAFGGGSISQEAGDTLAKKTQVINILGSSECGLLGEYITEPENWDWFHFAEPEMGIKWDPIDDGNNEFELFEMVIIRDKNLPQKQAVFANFPDMDEWDTKDIFRRHPKVPYYYKYQSRKDDVIVFSTGEKMNPINVDKGINGLSGVESSLVIGQRRPYPILLVELAGSANKGDTLPTIYEALEDLNKHSVKYAQSHRSDILIATPEKRFVRTPKGTVNRSQTNKLYEKEIGDMYDSAADVPDQTLQDQIDPSTNKTLTKSITSMIANMIGSKDLGLDDDVFANGLDSRQVQVVAATLARALLEQKDVMSIRNAVYTNPTAHGLVEHISQNKTEDVSAIFDGLFKKYSSILPKPPKQAPQPKEAHHVLLTGSIGFVGGFVLQSLLNHPAVTEITCLNRRIPDANSKPEPSNNKTLTHLKADLSKPSLALSKTEYTHLVSTVTEIIHCQWPVTFNLPLALFEPQIAGTANLIQLAYDSPNNTRIIFLSTIATIQGWDKAPTPVPEGPLDDENALDYAQGGYGQSKLLASKILEQASVTSGVPSAICRVGQVAGPVDTDGVWPPRDWFPTLLRASETMGVLPNSLGHFNEVDWLPVDYLSGALVTLTVDRDLGVLGTDKPKTGGKRKRERKPEGSRSGAAYYHLTNPPVSSYTDLVPDIRRRLEKGREIEVVETLGEWTERLDEWTSSSERGGSIADGGEMDVESSMAAAAALLEFYQGLARDLDKPSVRLDMALTVKKIPALRDVGAVNEGWIERWLDQWGVGQ